MKLISTHRYISPHIAI